MDLLMIEIRSINGKVLYTAKDAIDVRAALEEARKVGANLEGANLEGAKLKGANLEGANLEGANLEGAKGINPLHYNNLLILLDQPGNIRAYKLVIQSKEGPFNGGITYEIGKTYHVE